MLPDAGVAVRETVDGFNDDLKVKSFKVEDQALQSGRTREHVLNYSRQLVNGGVQSDKHCTFVSCKR